MAYGTVGTDNLTSSTGGVISPNITSLRNRIINGAMVIDQRNSGASVTIGPSLASNAYTIDRWAGFASSTRTFTAQQNTSAPIGFVNSEKLTVGVSGSPSASEQLYFGQNIEGFNVADLGWGTANAQTITISFWVNSSVTGTYGFGLSNNNGSRTYVATYVVNSANTWEQKTITIAGDTTGTWLTTNGIGLITRWDLGSGSNFNGTAGSWSSGYYWRTSGCVNWIANAGATFYITGVQFEAGTQATSFDYRQYGQELALCQRYFLQSTFYVNTGSAGVGSFLPATMRTIPTVTGAGAGFGLSSAHSAAYILPYQTTAAVQTLLIYAEL